MLYPIIPDTTIEKVLKIFNLSSKRYKSRIYCSKHNYLKSGNNLNKIDILFKKIDKKDD